MAFARRLLSFLVTPVCPPAGPLMLGRRRMAMVLVALAGAALAVFFLLAWGPGVVLWALAVAAGWGAVLLGPVQPS